VFEAAATFVPVAGIAGKLGKGAQLADKATDITRTAERALAHTGDDVGRVARVEKQAAAGVRQTGGRELKPHDFEGAEIKYVEIRNVNDVGQIAKNIGWKERDVKRVKDHIFNNEHKLDNGLRKFDADPEIANAWSRLQTGTHSPKDLQLLKHELFESRFESIFKVDYRTSHDATNRSGRLSGLE
jgi:hypothetical protein